MTVKQPGTRLKKQPRPRHAQVPESPPTPAHTSTRRSESLRGSAEIHQSRAGPLINRGRGGGPLKTLARRALLPQRGWRSGLSQASRVVKETGVLAGRRDGGVAGEVRLRPGDWRGRDDVAAGVRGAEAPRCCVYSSWSVARPGRAGPGPGQASGSPARAAQRPPRRPCARSLPWR